MSGLSPVLLTAQVAAGSSGRVGFVERIGRKLPKDRCFYGQRCCKAARLQGKKEGQEMTRKETEVCAGRACSTFSSLSKPAFEHGCGLASNLAGMSLTMGVSFSTTC